MKKLYREAVKEVIQICETKMPNSKYDKFYVQEMVKKFPTNEAIDELIQKLNNIESKSTDDYVITFLSIVDKK